MSIETIGLKNFWKNNKRSSLKWKLKNLRWELRYAWRRAWEGHDDMDMIEKAGISLAMANAVPELIAAADRTICYCEEHSAKYILENIIK